MEALMALMILLAIMGALCGLYGFLAGIERYIWMRHCRRISRITRRSVIRNNNK